MVGLDAVGNTTKAVTKGFAIGSAVIAAVALFASFVEIIGNQTLGVSFLEEAQRAGETVFDHVFINVADPRVFIGLLIGGAVPFLFSSLAIRAVGRTAGVVVQEVRRQFADGKIMSRRASSRLRAGHRHLHHRLAPGAGHPGAAGGAHPGDRRVRHRQVRPRRLPGGGHPGGPADGQLHVERRWCLGQRQEVHRRGATTAGKGSDAHKAAVIGDTVGDPFKDTAGPALNPLIKVMNLVSLLILPVVITLEDNNAARYAIAGAALLVLGVGRRLLQAQGSRAGRVRDARGERHLAVRA